MNAHPRFFHRYETIGWLIGGLLVLAAVLHWIARDDVPTQFGLRCFSLDGVEVDCRTLETLR
jgi:hypothetical protein